MKKMPEGIAVNGDVITWACERAGLARKTQKFPKIAAWEAGAASPSYPQLESMADEFRIPIAVFFFPSGQTCPGLRRHSAPCPTPSLRAFRDASSFC